jgi:hypothetical protein
LTDGKINEVLSSVPLEEEGNESTDHIREDDGSGSRPSRHVEEDDEDEDEDVCSDTNEDEDENDDATTFDKS